jgi:hypothetical protein
VAAAAPHPARTRRLRAAQLGAALVSGIGLLLGLNLLRPTPAETPASPSARTGLAADAPRPSDPGGTLAAWPGLLPSDLPEPSLTRRSARSHRTAASHAKSTSAAARPKPAKAKQIASTKPPERAQPPPPAAAAPAAASSAPVGAGASGWVIRRR